MTINYPEYIKDNSRLTLTQASRALECDKRTILSRAAALGIIRHPRKAKGVVVGRPYFTGHELWRIWAL